VICCELTPALVAACDCGIKRYECKVCKKQLVTDVLNNPISQEEAIELCSEVAWFEHKPRPFRYKCLQCNREGSSGAFRLSYVETPTLYQPWRTSAQLLFVCHCGCTTVECINAPVSTRAYINYLPLFTRMMAL
jgi:hypothetical protein